MTARWRRGLRAGLPAAALATAGLSSPAAADAVDALRELLAPLRSMSADFRQRVTEDGELVEEVTGQLSMRRPGRFTWVSEPPNAQTIVSDGRTLWRYDAELEQVVVSEISEGMASQSALALISGRLDGLGQRYEVRRLLPDVDERSRFRLRPRDGDGAFDAITLEFFKGVPVAATMRSGLGQRVDVRLNRIRRNPGIPLGEFTFRPPPGIEILRQ